MLNTNNDDSDRFKIGKLSLGYVNLPLCRTNVIFSLF